ncbi:hypothetical protein FNV43_RR21471 [Rhamnella rubrinervis]|uniref:Cytochrome P450 n=1 Tax=Rhamnella rubrinervis TaxID=2594499 RepID=A0A8K0DW96_9ROSA|nr:hypothetical protein FNV43_RR21471 [Rhamnella rubrinervis]
MDVVCGLTGRLKATSRKMDEFLDQVIEEHKTNLVEKKDFIDILLRVQNQKDEMLGPVLAQQEIKGILADMFVAGTDTTSTIMEWLMAELACEKSRGNEESTRRGKKSGGIEEQHRHGRYQSNGIFKMCDQRKSKATSIASSLSP